MRNNIHNLGITFLVQSVDLQKEKNLKINPVGTKTTTMDGGFTTDFTHPTITFDIGKFAVVTKFGCNQYLNKLRPLSSMYTMIPKSFIWEIQQIIPEFTIEKYCEILNNNKFVCKITTLENICNFVNPTNPTLVKNYIKERCDEGNIWNKSNSYFYNNSNRPEYIYEIFQNKHYFSENNSFTINLASVENLDNYEYIEVNLGNDFPKNRFYYFTFCLLRHLYYHNKTYTENILTHLFKNPTQNLIELIHKNFAKLYSQTLQTISYGNHDNNSSLFYSDNLEYLSPYVNYFIEQGKSNSLFTSTYPLDFYDPKGYVLSDIFIEDIFKKRNLTYLSVKLADKLYYLYSYTELYNKNFNKELYEFVDIDKKIEYTISSSCGSDIYSVIVENSMKQRLAYLYFPLNTVKIMKKKATLAPRLLSRQPSHNALRQALKANKYTENVLVRLGSTTILTNPEQYTVTVNSIQAIKNSSDKRKSKELFMQHNVPTADWWIYENNRFINKKTNQSTTIESFKKQDSNLLNFKLVAKLRWSSQNRNNYLLCTYEELTNFINTHRNELHKFIFERYYNYGKEYRVHVCGNQAFLIWRKALKEGISTWFKNSTNCVWFGENNPKFLTPPDNSYIAMVNDCIKAIQAVGLDIGAVDVLIQHNQDNQGNTRSDCKYIILETNSAPGMSSSDSGLSQTATAYLEEINKLIVSKIK